MARIKKIATELQIKDKLLDYSGDAGTSGQLLSSTGTGTNWITFSGVTASNGSSGRAAFFTGSTTIEGSDNFYWDNSNASLGIGTTSPSADLEIDGGSNNAFIQFTTPNTNYAGIRFGDPQTSTAGRIQYYHGDNSLQFDTSGRFTFEGGNVGIGTTSPSAPLTFGKSVYGAFDSEDFYRIKFQDQGGIHNDVGIGQTASGSMGFNITAGNSFIFNNGTSGEIARFNGTGLGIGTNNPGAKLQVNGSTSDTSANAFIARNSSSTSLFSIRNDGRVDVASGAIVHSGGGYANTSTNDSYFTGKLGIGTTSPSYKLDAAGEIKSDGYRIDLSATTQRAITSTGTDSIQFGDAGVNEFKFKNAAGTSMIINSSGDVGIGTTSPNEKLHVDGTSRFNGDIHVGSTASGFTYRPVESGSALDRYFLMFDETNNASYPFLTNRTANGAVVIKTGTAAGGGENEHFRIEGGDGTVDAYFTNVNLGIGTSSPAFKLDVFDTAINVVRVGSDDNARIIINSNANASATKEASQLSFADSGSTKWTLYKETNNDFYLYNAAANKYPIHAKAGGDIVLMEDGNNLGVGASSPAQKLHVKFVNTDTAFSGGGSGAWGSEGIRIENTSGTANTMAMLHFRNSDADIHIAGIRRGTDDSDLGFFFEGTQKVLFENDGSATFSGDITVSGDLNITGDINTQTVNNLDVVDKLITLGKGQTEANSNGSGILVDGSNASLLWDETNNTWDFNKSLDIVGNLNLSGNITVGGTVDGVDIAARDAVLTTTTNTANAALPKAGGSMTGNITFGSQYGVIFNDTNTRIYTNTDSPEDLLIEADQDLWLSPDGSIRIGDNVNVVYDNIGTSNSGTVVYGGFLNPASEVNMVHIPHIINDLAGFNRWSNATITTSGFYKSRSGSSGSYTYSNEVQTNDSGWANAFDSHSSTAGSWYSDNGSDGIYQHGTDTPGVVELAWTNEATYGLWVGIVFGSASFTATYVKIEAYRGGAWQTLCDITNNTDSVVLRQVANNSGTNAATTKLRYTLGGSVNNSYFRIHSFYMANYRAGDNNLNNTGTDTTRGINFLERYKDGYLHGHLRPGKDDTYDFGSSSYKWKNAYFDGVVTSDRVQSEGVFPQHFMIDTPGGGGASRTMQLGMSGSSLYFKKSDTTGDVVFRNSNNTNLMTIGLADTGQVTVLNELEAGSLDINGNANFAGSVHLDSDSAQLQLGDDNDMQVYHNGANGFVKAGTGDLILQSDGDDIKILAEDDVVIRDNDDSTEMAKFINGGAVELYHNGSKKFETAGAGAQVIGSFYLTSGNYIHFDNGVTNDYAIRKSGTTLSFKTGGSYNFQSGDATFAGSLDVNGTASDIAFVGGSMDFNDTNNYIRITKSSASAQLGLFRSGNNVGGMYIGGASDGFRIFTEGFSSKFHLDQSGNATFTGDVLLGDNQKAKFGDNPDLQIYHNGSHSFIQDIGAGDLRLLASSIKLQNTSESNILTLASDLSATFAGGVSYSGTLTSTGSTTVPAYFRSTANVSYIQLQNSSTGTSGTSDGLTVGVNGSNAYIWQRENASLLLGTNDTAAVTINSSQNTTFAGNVEIGTNTLNFADNGKARFGNSTDLQIYHDATNSKIENSTGQLRIINNAVDKSVMLQATSDGSGSNVTESYLSLLPSFGSGAVFVYKDFLMAQDDTKIRLGASQDLEIYHDGTDSYIDDSGTGDLRIRSNFLKIEKYTGETMATFNDDNAVTLYYNNVAKFETTSDGIAISDYLIHSGDSDTKIGFFQNDGIIAYVGGNEVFSATSAGTAISHNGSAKIITQATSVDIYDADLGLSLNKVVKDRSIPCLFNSNFLDGTGAGINVVPFNSLSEAAVSTATYYHFLTMPYAGKLKRVVLKNVSGSLGSGFTTQLFLYVNGSQQASSSELSISTDRITWTPTSNNTFSAGDEISFAYQKSAAGTGITWAGVSFGVAIELTDYDI